VPTRYGPWDRTGLVGGWLSAAWPGSGPRSGQSTGALALASDPCCGL